MVRRRTDAARKWRLLRRAHLVSQDGLRGATDGRHGVRVIHRLVQLVVSVSSAFIGGVIVVTGQPAVHAEVVCAHGRQVGQMVVVEIQFLV